MWFFRTNLTSRGQTKNEYGEYKKKKIFWSCFQSCNLHKLTWILLKISLSHRLLFRTIPLLSSACFLCTAKWSRALRNGDFVEARISTDPRENNVIMTSSFPALDSPQRPADLVVDAIEKTWHNREESRFESLHVVHEKSDVPLIKPYTGSKAEHCELQQKWTQWLFFGKRV